MARTFWQGYQAFLTQARLWTGESGERPVVEAVRARARHDPDAFHAWVQSQGWGRAYVERHLLYVVDHPEEVRELLRRGYPARRIPLRLLDRTALAAALTEADWRTAVDRLFQGSRQPHWAGQRVWLFDSSPELRRREGLAPSVAEALIELVCPPGGFVVDPLAGSGELVRAARATGRRAWGGDLRPSSADVVQADVTDLLQHVPERSADVLILHPPTFGAWAKTTADLADVPHSEHYAAYLDGIVGFLLTTRAVLKPGGVVVLIARPPRDGHVFLAPFELALGEHGLTPSAYRLAVSRDGTEDWHFFIAQDTKE
ncbi:hypothetical protein QOL99_04690 [Deinococcus sp. MIMF12]|uniref:DNA methylase N-4/N-6 domain-containing protein n=1 Tax=Deinococcus rhizophilus TaxID=3049544 RepID=A0ABT7JEG3_9DEIO|nr:hypothetical protein [Deinococcus rhizophilus]MDL2343447.1 hypothetical protein [Deinococcus rhizophilus]